MISPDEYDRILEENPELHVHPLRLSPSRCDNPHFKMDNPAEEVKPGDAECDLGTLVSEGSIQVPVTGRRETKFAETQTAQVNRCRDLLAKTLQTQPHCVKEATEDNSMAEALSIT